MKTAYVLSLLSLLAVTLLPATAAADAQRGEELHNQQCIACHAARFGGDGSAIYTRENRRVNSFEALHKQVNRCKNNLQVSWFDDEVKDVADYLNATYYHFEE